MKKVSVILSLVAASSLMAADVELYGVAHLSGDSVNNGKNSTGTISSNSSRLGVKASQDIGNGLTAVGQFEMGVDLTGRGIDDGNGGDFTTGANGFFTSARDSFAGVKGSFGTVVAGNLGAQNQWIYDYNLFADQVGDLGNLLGAGGVGPDRASGTVAYVSPTFAGFTGILAYMAPSTNNGSNATAAGDVSAVVAKINYDMGNGFKAGIGYIGVNTDSNSTTVKNPSEVALSASYTHDMFSVGGGYAMMKSPGLVDNVDRTVWHVGASVSPMDVLKVKAHYVALNDDAVNADSKMFAVGVDYKLGKDVTSYVAYSKTNNQANAGYLANNWGHGQSAVGKDVIAGTQTLGLDPSAISIGLVYKFGGSIYKN